MNQFSSRINKFIYYCVTHAVKFEKAILMTNLLYNKFFGKEMLNFLHILKK